MLLTEQDHYILCTAMLLHVYHELIKDQLQLVFLIGGNVAPEGRLITDYKHFSLPGIESHEQVMHLFAMISVVVTDNIFIPEPASALLLVTGLLGLFAVRLTPLARDRC